MDNYIIIVICLLIIFFCAVGIVLIVKNYSFNFDFFENKLLAKISKRKKQKKNTELYLKIASNFIKTNSKSVPNCYNDLMDELKKYCAECKNEFEVWEYNKDEYEKSAITVIANLSFEMLASGRYHLYKGFLNPMNCSGDLRNIYNCAMQWSVNKGHISKEFLEEEAQALSSCIYNVG